LCKHCYVNYVFFSVRFFFSILQTNNFYHFSVCEKNEKTNILSLDYVKEYDNEMSSLRNDDIASFFKNMNKTRGATSRLNYVVEYSQEKRNTIYSSPPPQTHTHTHIHSSKIYLFANGLMSNWQFLNIASTLGHIKKTKLNTMEHLKNLISKR
jgi:hypothetical protein